MNENEKNALILLTQLCQESQNELNARIASRQSFIELLETKYNSKFNPQTGEFVKSVDGHPDKSVPVNP